MTIETLRAKNPDLQLYSIHDPEFAEYGRVITGLPAAELIAAAQEIPAPADGSKYEATVPALEATPFAQPMQAQLFGELPAQVGYCWGHNTTMNAMEWHTTTLFRSPRPPGRPESEPRRCVHVPRILPGSGGHCGGVRNQPALLPVRSVGGRLWLHRRTAAGH